MTGSAAVALRLLPGKGRGVVAARDLHEDQILSVDACLPLGAADCARLEETSLHGHYFAHPERPGEGCLVFGPTSLVNHSATPNCRLEWCEDPAAGWTVRLIARRALAAGEELTIDYDCDLWFDPTA